MHKVTVSWTFGNFTPTVEVEISDEAVKEMLRKGALQVLQRGPAGEVEKSLAGHTWPVGKRGGAIRPEGFERSSIPFTAEKAAKVQAGFSTEASLYEGGPTVSFKCTGVTEHVAGESTGPGKIASAVSDLVDDDMAEMLRVKFALPEGTDKAEVIRTFLASKRAK